MMAFLRHNELACIVIYRSSISLYKSFASPYKHIVTLPRLKFNAHHEFLITLASVDGPAALLLALSSLLAFVMTIMLNAILAILRRAFDGHASSLY